MTKLKARTVDAFESVTRSVLDYFEHSPEPPFVPSALTMGHRRSLMLWSMIIIAVVGLDFDPEQVPGLGVPLDEASRGYFTAGAVAVLIYHWAMYAAQWYRDVLLYDVRAGLVDLAFTSKLERQVAHVEYLTALGEAPEEWLARRDQALKLFEGQSSMADRLVRWLIRWPPQLLFAVAVGFLAKAYVSFAIAWGIALAIFFGVREVERRAKKKAQVAAAMTVPD